MSLGSGGVAVFINYEQSRNPRHRPVNCQCASVAYCNGRLRRMSNEYPSCWSNVSGKEEVPRRAIGSCSTWFRSSMFRLSNRDEEAEHTQRFLYGFVIREPWNVWKERRYLIPNK